MVIFPRFGAILGISLWEPIITVTQFNCQIHMSEEQLPSPEEYDARIRATIPRYDGLLADALDVAVHSGVDVKYWVDVGAGTGNMAIMAMARFPKAKFTLLDISSDMLSVAKIKAGEDRTAYVHGSSDKMNIADQSADVVSCIQSNHYYDEGGHAKVLEECYRILRPGGLIIVSENVATRTETGYGILRSRLKSYLTDKGRSDNAAEGYLDRYGTEFHPHTAEQHIKLMEDAGFTDVEIFFYNYGQIGLYGFRR